MPTRSNTDKRRNRTLSSRLIRRSSARSSAGLCCAVREGGSTVHRARTAGVGGDHGWSKIPSACWVGTCSMQRRCSPRPDAHALAQRFLVVVVGMRAIVIRSALTTEFPRNAVRPRPGQTNPRRRDPQTPRRARAPGASRTTEVHRSGPPTHRPRSSRVGHP